MAGVTRRFCPAVKTRSLSRCGPCSRIGMRFRVAPVRSSISGITVSSMAIVGTKGLCVDGELPAFATAASSRRRLSHRTRRACGPCPFQCIPPPARAGRKSWARDRASFASSPARPTTAGAASSAASPLILRPMSRIERFELPELTIGPLELFGVGIALVLD